MLPSLTSTDGRTSHVLLADVILWIYIASPALYIARTVSNMPPDQSEVQKLYYTVEFSVIEASQLVTMEVKRYSRTPSESATETPASIRDVDCVPTMVTTFTTHYIHYAATGNIVKFFIAKIQYKVTRELHIHVQYVGWLNLYHQI